MFTANIKKLTNYQLTMTRDEQIRNAIDTIFPIPPSEKGRKYEQALMATGFEGGVKWADANPKSPWISVEDDLPCNHEELIITGNYYKKETINVITIDKHEIIDNYMVLCDGGKWEWKYGVKPYYWMPIPELPKEKEIKL